MTLTSERKHTDLVILEVYSGLSMVVADVASFLCDKLRLPLISVLHGGNLPVFVRRHPNWTKRVLRRSTFLVAPSKFIAKDLSALGFEIRVIPNTIELDKYSHRARGRVLPRLLWMRSFHSIYDPEMAVRVFSRVRQNYPNATLVMAGADKGIQREVKDLVDELELSDAVRFPGFLEMPAKLREFDAADIYINTTKIDNTPVSVIEAFAMGLPVVSTQVGGIGDLIEHRTNGMLVPGQGVDEMAKAVGELLEHPELADSISANARATAEASSWVRVLPLWQDLFDRIIERGKAKTTRNGRSVAKFIQT